jgi:hypothetical protein
MTISFRQSRRVYLSWLFVSSFALTFLFFYLYPASMETAFPFFFFILLASPTLILFNCLIFPFCEKPAEFSFAKISTAFYAALILISCTTYQSDGSLGAVVAQILLLVLVSGLLFMLIAIGVKNFRHRRKPAALLTRGLFRDTFGTIIGGWILGILFWSLTTPPVIIAAAEKMAAGAPYCINAHSGPARRLIDLTALRFYSSGYQWRNMGDRHGTLTVVVKASGHHQNKTGLTYDHFFYWSYRLRAFVPDGYWVHDPRNAGSCIPDRKFADKLPLF